ncbi:hypothetical protein EXS74_03810 [Candidatus Woesearchaeota archaeon]|nr:hypothetical protein [Candidatus Woesearchaeota archaeon]
MGNTTGYITGALSALALAAGIGYTINSPSLANDAVKDAQSSIVRTLESPKGYIGEGNALEVLADAAHDIGQGNPARAWQTLDRIDVGIENTPLQDQRLRSSNYKHTQDFDEYVGHGLDQRWVLADYSPSGLKTNGQVLLALAGLGLGALTIAGVAKKP